MGAARDTLSPRRGVVTHRALGAGRPKPQPADDRRLRESEQCFRLGFEHAPVGQSITDLDGRFLEVNAALCRLTGYAHDGLRALAVHEITHPEDHEAHAVQLGRLLAGEIETYTVEQRCVRADGHAVRVLLAASLMPIADGQPLCLISQWQDVTARRDHEAVLAVANAHHLAALEHAATHDALTGLPNRRVVEQRLSRLLDPSEPRAAGQVVAVLFCDLDGFKAVNDAHGHDAGDRLLWEVAHRLRACARAEDTVGRLGGDEFVVLVTATPDEDARAVSAALARRVCAAVAARYDGPALEPPLTVSVGVALSRAGADPVGLLCEADAAMYLAKRAGKDGFAFAGFGQAAVAPGA